jgi:hypothetical protein
MMQVGEGLGVGDKSSQEDIIPLNIRGHDSAE